MRGHRVSIRILRILAVAVPLIAVGVLIFTVRSSQAPTAGRPEERGESGGGIARLVREDRPAPTFELPTVEGERTISLASLSGRVVLLDFWASWCPSCREEAPTMQAFWRKYEPLGVQFLGVNVNDTKEAALAFEKEFGITFPSVFDPRGEFASSYGVYGIPTFMVIDRQGRIIYRLAGKMRTSDLQGALDEVVGNT